MITIANNFPKSEIEHFCLDGDPTPEDIITLVSFPTPRTIEFQYDAADPSTKWHGECVMGSSFKLTCGRGGTGMLHRIPGSTPIYEGHWSKWGEVGMWKITLVR